MFKKELEHDAPFDTTKRDYPVGLLPFGDHPQFLHAGGDRRDNALSWAWIAYNSNIITIEEKIVNPAFASMLRVDYPADRKDGMRQAIAQARVDESYHTLMHLHAVAVTRAHRGPQFDMDRLPQPLVVEALHDLQSRHAERWKRDLIGIAFAALTEITLAKSLEALAKDTSYQPLHSAVVSWHNRDEYAHASLMQTMIKEMYVTLSGAEKDFFTHILPSAHEACEADDHTVWQAVLDNARFPNGSRVLTECAEASSPAIDYEGLRKVAESIDAVDRIAVPWPP